MRVFRAAAEFFEEVVHPLMAFLTRTTVHFGAPRIILKQLLQSKKFMESLEWPGTAAAMHQGSGRE